MIGLQRYLEARFGTLRDARRGAVFFVEHGLGVFELEALRNDVRANLCARSLESDWWDKHDLPLLVAASEVGYRYKGAGTDFWPITEKELGVNLSLANRRRIKDLFVRAAERFRGARPADTAWAQAFHLIAWPITHALLPLEFHRPFALALAKLRVSAEGAQDDALYRAVQIAAQHPTARFGTLLEDASVVVALARCLLGQQLSDLSEQIVERLSVDLDADELARREVAVARSIQRAAAPLRAASKLEPTLVTQGSFQLRRVDKDIILEASFPLLEPDVARQLRSALRRRRFSPRLWGLTERVPSDQVLSGLPFALKFEALPPTDAQVFSDVELGGLDPKDVELLRSFELRLEPPLLFAVGAEGELARHVQGIDLTDSRVYWLLEKDGVEYKGVRCLGDVGPLKCLELNPRSAAGVRVLEKLGYQVRASISVHFAGPPPIRWEGIIPTFVSGEQCLIVPQRLSEETLLSLNFNGQSALVGASGLMRVTLAEGVQRLQASIGADSRDYQLLGLKSAPLRPEPPVRVVLCSEERTIQALLAGRLSFVVESFVAIRGLTLTLDLDVAGHRFSSFGLLEALPAVISREHPILRVLLCDDVVELASGATNATLRARVGHLASASWELERVVRPCWWDLSGVLSLNSEEGSLNFGVVNAAEPTSAPSARPLGEDAYLLVPTGLDPNEFGVEAAFATLCLAPARAPLHPPHADKPRLVRRRRGEHAGLGLEELLEAYLRWSLAETRSALGDLRRRQISMRLDAWVAELCCGAEWSQEEEALLQAEPWALLEQACAELGLGRCVELSEAHEAEVRRLALEGLRRTLPRLWDRSEFNDYEVLDRAFADAYALFAERCRARGEKELADELDDADPGDDPTLWEQALERGRKALDMPGLAAMLLPSNGAPRLMALDVRGLALDDVADELVAWSKASGRAFAGGSPSRSTLKAIYSLWVAPEVALKADWRGALNALLTERSIARAVRYLALKARNSWRGAV
jgi:hypothetical protein